MTREEHVKTLTRKTYDKYQLKIDWKKVPWSGEYIETRLSDGTIELVDRMVEFAFCKMYAHYYIDRYCLTFDPQKGPIPFKLFDFQQEALKDFQKHSKVIFRKSRQVGASVLSGCYALWKANFYKAQVIKIISLTQNDALEFKEKTIDLNYYEMPGFLKTKTTKAGYSKTKLKMVNQSQIRVLAKSKNAGRGGTPSLVIIDEAAFNEWMDKIWEAIEPSLDKGGDVIVISTTNGVGNWYHLTYTNAEVKQNEFYPIFIPWWRYPNRDNPWLQDVLDGKISNVEDFVRSKEQEQLNYQGGDPEKAPWLWKRRHNAKTERVFKQEILAEFLGSGETVTTFNTITRLDAQTQAPKWVDRLPSDDSQAPIPGLWVWKDALDHSYILTSDTATGHGKDFSTFEVVDIDEKEQCAEYKWQIATDRFGEVIKKVARYYNNAYVVIETNHPGPAVFNEVFKSKIDPYYNVYAINKGRDIVSWETTPKSRVLLVESYFKDVENNYTKVYSERLIGEIKTFIWSEAGKAEAMAGYNDDLIIAYALYCHLKEEALAARPVGFATSSQDLMSVNIDLEEDWGGKEQFIQDKMGVDMETYYWLTGKPMPPKYVQYKRIKNKENEESLQDAMTAITGEEASEAIKPVVEPQLTTNFKRQAPPSWLMDRVNTPVKK